jgi:hypothetical protein
MVVEETLRKLGYDVNPEKTNTMNNKECTVRYTGIPIELECQESYSIKLEITIHLNIDNQNELPYVVADILCNTTQSVEVSDVPWCTNFHFINIPIQDLGTEMAIDMIAQYEVILDWIEDTNIPEV